MHTRALLLGLALLGSAVPALAAQPEFYLGGSVGRSDTDYENASGGDTARIYGGVRFPGNWGVELGAYDLGDISIDDRGLRYDLGLEGYSLMGVYNIRPAQTSGFGVFFKGGLHNTESTLRTAALPVQEDDTTSLALGLGADYAFGRNLSVRAELEFLTGVKDFSTTDDTTISHFSLGGELRF